MLSLKKKIGTAGRVFKSHGLRGVAGVLVTHKLGRYRGEVRRWLWQDNWWVGKLIEAGGDLVRIEGCRFSVRNPAIPTAAKSRFLFDRYEPSERAAIKKFLDPSLPVVEFGGSIGVVACLTNRRLRDPARHVVVEANPDLIPLLEKNRELNGCRFAVLHRAVAYGGPTVTFHQNDDFVSSSVQLRAARSVTVPAVTLRDVAGQFGFDRFTLICDIEGGEIDLVRFDEDVLRERVETFIVEVHETIAGPAATRGMLARLESLGFEPVFADWETYVLQKRAGAARGGRPAAAPARVA